MSSGRAEEEAGRLRSQLAGRETGAEERTDRLEQQARRWGQELNVEQRSHSTSTGPTGIVLKTVHLPECHNLVRDPDLRHRDRVENLSGRAPTYPFMLDRKSTRLNSSH